MSIWILVVIVVLVAVVAVAVVSRQSTHEVPANQRLAIYRGQVFRSLGGPGPTIVRPALERVVTLTVGDEGAALIEGHAQFGGADVPVRASAFFEPGERVRIIGFDRDQAAVIVKAE